MWISLQKQDLNPQNRVNFRFPRFTEHHEEYASIPYISKSGCQILRHYFVNNGIRHTVPSFWYQPFSTTQRFPICGVINFANIPTHPSTCSLSNKTSKIRQAHLAVSMEGRRTSRLWPNYDRPVAKIPSANSKRWMPVSAINLACVSSYRFLIGRAGNS